MQIRFGCGDPFPPDIYFKGTRLDDDLSYILNEGEMFPAYMVKELRKHKPVIIDRIHEVLRCYGGGNAVIGRSLVATLNLTCFKGAPTGLLCDAIILTKKHCPFLFSFCDNTSEDIRRYNIELSKNAKRLIRKFTNEQFTVVFCVLDRSRIKTNKDMEVFLKDRRKIQLQRCFQEQALMREDKFHSIHKALSISIARTNIPKPEKPRNHLNDFFHLLTLDQLTALMNSIDVSQSLVRVQCTSGKTVCMFELAERLQKKAPTVLIRETLESDTKENRPPHVKLHQIHEVISGQIDMSVFHNFIVETTELTYETIQNYFPDRTKTTWIFQRGGKHPPSPLNIALFGWQKTGKSSIGNRIINKCAFKTNIFPHTDTNSVSESGRNITVTEISCLSLTEVESTRASISFLTRQVETMNAILLVLRASQMTQEQELMLRLICSTFSDYLFSKLIVVFTYVDKKPCVDDFLCDAPDDLKAVFEKCENRYMFYNIRPVSQTELMDPEFRCLIDLVEDIGNQRTRYIPSEKVLKRFMNEWQIVSKEIKKPNKKFWDLLQKSMMDLLSGKG